MNQVHIDNINLRLHYETATSVLLVLDKACFQVPTLTNQLH